MMHPALSAMLLVALLQATFSSAVPNPLGTVDEARSKGAVNELIGDSTAGEGDVAQVGGDKSGVENEVEHGPDELGQDEEYVNSCECPKAFCYNNYYYLSYLILIVLLMMQGGHVIDR